MSGSCSETKCLFIYWLFTIKAAINILVDVPYPFGEITIITLANIIIVWPYRDKKVRNELVLFTIQNKHV